MVKIHLTPSVIALTVSNLVPLIGVLFWNWDVFQILFLYWLESLVIVFYTVLKIIKFPSTKRPTESTINDHQINSVPSIIKYISIPILIVNYGVFMFGHLVLLVILFGTTMFNSSAQQFSYNQILSNSSSIILAILFLFISHGISFFTNFIGKKEYEKLKIEKIMFLPFRRVWIMHITIVLGAFIISFFNSPKSLILLLVILKIVVDIFAHLKEHNFQ